MQQPIYVQASDIAMIKGINDFKDLMRKQTPIKPEVYLPIFAYLDLYIKEIAPKNKEETNPDVKYITTTIMCTNADIINSVKKIEDKLYNQTEIKPEVYLKIIQKIREYAEMLENQDKNGTLPSFMKQPENKENEKQEQLAKEDSATKKEDLDLTNLKKLLGDKK